MNILFLIDILYYLYQFLYYLFWFLELILQKFHEYINILCISFMNI